MSALVSEGVEKLRPYSPGKAPEELAREAGIAHASKLASNENPLGPSPLAIAAVERAVAEMHRYPDAHVFELREKLAARLAVTAQELVFGNGSNELLDLTVQTFCREVHHIVFAEPAFVVYRMAALSHNVPFTAVPLKEHVHDLPAMAKAVRPNTRIVFVANPNNPTGTHVSGELLAAFLKTVPPEVIVVIDEAYFEYVTADDYLSGLRLRKLHPRLVVLRTFSKAYGLAGLRLGYGVFPEELSSYMERVRAPFNANSLAQAAAFAALDDEKFIADVRSSNREQLERLNAGLSELGVRCVPSQANFVLVELERSAKEVNAELLSRGVIVRPIPGLDNSLRISVGLPRENERLLTALAEILR